MDTVHGFMAFCKYQAQTHYRNVSKFREKCHFFTIFSRWVKAYPLVIALYTVGKVFAKKIAGEGMRMRANRVLVAKGWGVYGYQ
jgi:hypothetical protein